MKLLRSIHRRLGLKYRLDRCLGWVRRFGPRRALPAYRRIWSKNGDAQPFVVPGVPHPLLLRSGTADASTFEKIFIWNGYDLDFPADVRTIVDAGANIGLSAAFFALRFPDAKIVAVEPELRNFELLQRNAAPYPNVIPLHAALWGEDTRLALANPDDRVDSFRFARHGAAQAVDALSVSSLLERFGIDTLDVLKIDIEGGEEAVFAARPEWVSRVRMFIVELHGSEATRAFAEATAALPAKRYRHGEDEVVLVDRA